MFIALIVNSPLEDEEEESVSCEDGEDLFEDGLEVEEEQDL